ncbi:Chemotaxis protein methyltransferase CheR [hydrothermal vent metagenome]|uniref:protein-glutamate O-methyltransferase n=1 Tax=hydrothermal vent metagenome TaxID=652676 RepID=A0A3B1B654_9ZZZZ
MQRNSKEREFHLSKKDFNKIREIVKKRSGIVLSESKQNMVYSRLTKRLRALDLNSFNEYCSIIDDDSSDEMVDFTNAITTNLTAFFRENHHFEFLADKLIPHLLKHKMERKIRIWSAGCSSGEEPYSIAMVMMENIPADYDIKILATDLDTNMVNTAKQGIYTQERVEGLGRSRLRNWVKKGRGEHQGMIRISQTIRDVITFKQLNLMLGWPMKGEFDFIFCRNVVIYFDKPTQRILFDRYANLLAPNAHLFIGHSESLNNVSDRFKLLGQTIYKKND